MADVDRSFRNISLSFWGSERQAPSTLQLALRFSRILELREKEGRHHPDMTMEQCLMDVTNEFNESPGLQAKHRVEDDRFKAVPNLLTGSCEVIWLVHVLCVLLTACTVGSIACALSGVLRRLVVSSGSILILSSGTKVLFPPSSFVDSGG